MNDYLKTFRPLKAITINLQKTELCFTYFYKEWLCLKLQLKKLNTEISKKILEIIDTREKMLLESPVLLLALYLDPGFKFLLKPIQVTTAQNHLKNLADNLTTIEQHCEPISETEPSLSVEAASVPVSQNNDNDMDFLNSQDSENGSLNVPEKYSSIMNFNPDRIVDHTVDILMYWKVKSSAHPLLYNLAETILSVPATQCSVERSFRALASIQF